MSGNQPITVEVLREELSATKNDLREELSATKNDLREELSATKNDLREEFNKQGSGIRKELREELDRQGNAIRKELRDGLSKQGKKFKESLIEQGKKFRRQLNAVDGHFEKNQAVMAESIATIQEQLAVMSNMIEKNTEDIDIIKLNMNLIRGDLKTKVDREEFAALEKRVLFLERKAARNC